MRFHPWVHAHDHDPSSTRLEANGVPRDTPKLDADVGLAPWVRMVFRRRKDWEILRLGPRSGDDEGVLDLAAVGVVQGVEDGVVLAVEGGGGVKGANTNRGYTHMQSCSSS
jgi:hypothetical protein